ncbi:MAG: right-handed parallel beta-helix repeat-containing protein, partial [Clostridia bacterium]|nr:right-handed parallel beta-helix repeat-containing protein [Clostridia bacterium]
SKFENFRCVNGRGTAISVSDMWGFIFMSDMVLDYSGTEERHGTRVSFPGFKMKDNAGALITNVKVIGDPKGTPEGHGFQFLSSAAVWMREISAESCSGCGIDISASWSYLLNSNIRNCAGTGVYATRCFTLQIVNTDIFCPGNHSSDMNGIFFGNGSHNQICNVKITGAGANGVFIQGSANNSVCGLKVEGCGGYGLLDYGALTALTDVYGESNGKGLTGRR